MAQYFIFKDDEKQGPYSVEELMDRGVSSETLVWTEGMEQWQPAWKVGELKTVVEQKRENVVVPPPLPQELQAQKTVSNSPSDEAQPTDRKRKKSRKGCLISCIIAVVVVLVLMFTCPSADKHKEVLSNEVNTAVSNVATGSYGILGAVGSMLASGVVNVAVGEFLDVDDYLLFSVGKLSYGGDTNVISFGILNHIFTLNSEIIEKKLNEIKDSLPFNE